MRSTGDARKLACNAGYLRFFSAVIETTSGTPAHWLERPVLFRAPDMERFSHRLNQPPDPSRDFLEQDAYLFCAENLKDFDPETGRGQLMWKRHRRKPRIAFNHMTMPLHISLPTTPCMERFWSGTWP